MKNQLVDSIQAFVHYEGKSETIMEEDVFVTITKPRNPKHHKLVWAMLGYTSRHMDRFDHLQDSDDLYFWFKDTYGHYKSMPRKDGSIAKMYKSFSFAEMDEIEWRPIAEQIKQYCYAVLNHQKKSKEIINGLLEIELPHLKG